MTIPNIKIFLDSADLAVIERYATDPVISGFTTNPTLMRRAGVTDYAAFARDVLRLVGDKPVSFEVVSDDFAEMERQARVIAAWGENVYVKIPVTNMAGDELSVVIQRLSSAGVKVNVTAVLTLQQARNVIVALDARIPSIVSVFAGRIADTGRNARDIVMDIVMLRKLRQDIEILWASTREVHNVIQAAQACAQIITLTPDLVAKLPMLGQDLDALALATVRQLTGDAIAAGYTL